MLTNTQPAKVVLITGAARRIGAVIARAFHAAGYCVIIHYRNAVVEAQALADAFNTLRPDSAQTIPADLDQLADINRLAEQAAAYWGVIDVLVNNASSFYPTAIGTTTAADWDGLFNSNLKAPFFLSQALAAKLAERQGSIINIADIHASRPLKAYPVYCAAKAGLVMLTKALAKELGPNLRVNAVAPGAMMWPEQANTLTAAVQEKIIAQTALKRQGRPEDIADAVLFLSQANYITGQVLAVDGGRLLDAG